MKLLITSPDALMDHEKNEPFNDVFTALDYFLENNNENTVVVVSVDKKKLSDIDKKYNPIEIRSNLRGSAELVNILIKKLNCNYSDVIILGCKDHDVYTASNSKTLLLRADFAKPNNPVSIIYQKEYGVEINTPQSLMAFFKHYFLIKTPWFYKLEVDSITTLYALTEANTYDKKIDYVKLCTDFRNCLKSGENQYLYPFTVYFLISTYMIFREMAGIKFWAIYPTSTGEVNADLEFFLKKARESYGGRPKAPIFLRHTISQKRHYKKSDERIKDGCKSQFATIRLNPKFQGKLKGESVCVIDDFTTYGSSCETIRHLLKEAGVSKIIFIALGKFGHNYYKYNYKINGDVFNEYTAEEVKPYELIAGDKNPASNMDFLLSINSLK